MRTAHQALLHQGRDQLAEREHLRGAELRRRVGPDRLRAAFAVKAIAGRISERIVRANRATATRARMDEKQMVVFLEVVIGQLPVKIGSASCRERGCQYV